MVYKDRVLRQKNKEYLSKVITKSNSYFPVILHLCFVINFYLKN